MMTAMTMMTAMCMGDSAMCGCVMQFFMTGTPENKNAA